MTPASREETEALAAAQLARALRMLEQRPSNWRGFVRHLEQAAELGNAEAQETLGAWYIEGLTDEDGSSVLRRSPKRGVRWLEAAAKSNNLLAIFRLGSCYDHGEGVRVDKDAALRLYRRAAAGGDAHAAANVAGIYRQAGRVKAEERWLARAVQLGDTDARIELNRRVLSKRVPRSRKQRALADLRAIAKTASQVDDRLDAISILSEAYRLGRGVQQSSKLAERWLQAAKNVAVRKPQKGPRQGNRRH
jgi:TPR repeat protein